MSDSLVLDIAQTILDGFDRHYSLFRELSRGARGRFVRGDWAAVREAVRTRIDMYDARVREAVEGVRARFGDAAADDALFREVKVAYIGLLYEHKQPECAETLDRKSTRLNSSH